MSPARADAMIRNLEFEFARNRERYEFLKWGQQAFETFKVVPPGIGIVHQVNLEYLAKGVLSAKIDGETVYYPDTLVGTDSHTTMINGLGIVGWGVGGIEAEAGMLGQPVYFLTPEVVGVHMTGALREGVTATDLALHVTEMLRKQKVVGKFVEFYGPGAASLSLPDRATIANMAPEYGATMGFFPVDAESVNYLKATGRTQAQIEAFETYFKAQKLFGIPDQGGRHRLQHRPRAQPRRRLAQRGRPEAPAGPHRAARPQGEIPRRARQAGDRKWLRQEGRARRARRRHAQRHRARRPTSISSTAACSSPPSPAAPTPAIRRVMIAAGLARQEGGRARPHGQSPR